MARAQDLAGLAALAGLGYMLSKKGDTATSTDTGVDSNPTRGAGYQSTETRLPDTGDETDRLLARAPAPDYSNEGRGAAPKMNVRSPALTSSAPVKPAPKPADNTTAIAYPRMPGSFEGQNLPAKTVEDAVRNEENARTVAKAAQADANKAANAKKNKEAATKYSNATDQYANLSRAIAVTDARKRAANTLKRQTQLSPFKKGGSVSSASKRADGIASRGKTRGKMY